jgi:hypothetical protein
MSGSSGRTEPAGRDGELRQESKKNETNCFALCSPWRAWDKWFCINTIRIFIDGRTLAQSWGVDKLAADRSAETNLGAAATSGRATAGYDVFLAGRGFFGFGFSAVFRAGALTSLKVRL